MSLSFYEVPMFRYWQTDGLSDAGVAKKDIEGEIAFGGKWQADSVSDRLHESLSEELVDYFFLPGAHCSSYLVSYWAAIQKQTQLRQGVRGGIFVFCFTLQLVRKLSLFLTACLSFTFLLGHGVIDGLQCEHFITSKLNKLISTHLAFLLILGSAGLLVLSLLKFNKYSQYSDLRPSQSPRMWRSTCPRRPCRTWSPRWGRTACPGPPDRRGCTRSCTRSRTSARTCPRTGSRTSRPPPSCTACRRQCRRPDWGWFQYNENWVLIVGMWDPVMSWQLVNKTNVGGMSQTGLVSLSF